MTGSEIPIIDIAPFERGGAGAVAAAVGAAGRDIGFFIVAGHGVSPAAIERLDGAACSLFDLPDADKRRLVAAPTVPGGIGFAPLGAEALAATQGITTPGDIKESLNYGPGLAGAAWPDRPAGLRAACLAYFAEMEGLAQRLRRIFCAAIGLPQDYFEADFIDHLSALRVINYPALDREPLPGQLRAGAHTDYGFMTILRADARQGGLQVRARDGGWLDAPAIADSFVVNIGDAFMRWTNDAWVSTPHRVVNPTARGSGRRQSIPFFVNPSARTQIACLAPFVATGRPAKYPPISYGDYIALKTRQAFAPQALASPP